MRAPPITILYVFGVMDRGGAELRTVELMRHLDPAQFRLVFATLTGRPGSLADEIRAFGGEVYPCRLGPTFPARFIRLLRLVEPTVVHSCVATFSGAVLVLARGAGVPRRVAHFHSSQDRHGASPRGLVQRAVMRQLIDASATDLVAVAEAAMNGMWRPDWRRDRRCQVVYNGLDVATYARALADAPTLPRRIPTVVHVGRPGPVKNRTRAVDIMAGLRRRGARMRLLIVGRQDDTETIDLLQRATRLGVSDAVELTGERHDVPHLLAAANLLLVTSRHEGLPSVVLEACAAGTPVLAPELPGIEEIARRLSGVTMLPQATADDVWAAEVQRLVATPPSTADRGTALRAFTVSPFTVDSWRGHLTRIWSQA
jgi:glycosyltransferase involved in cell wall biosynthesis